MNADLVLFPILIAVFLGTGRVFVRKRWMNVVEIIGVLLSTVPLFVYHPFGVFIVGGWSSALGVEVKYTPISMWFILSLLVVWMAFKMRCERWDSVMESLADYLFAALFALFISNDLFNIYVTMELSSLISFLMVGYGERPSRIWAALKYIFLSSVALSLYLIGMILIYSHVGVLSVDALKGENVPNFAISFVVVALLVKGGTFALSSWMLDVYSKSKRAVAMLLSGTSVNMGLYAMITLLPIMSGELRSYVVYFGILSAIGGALYAWGEQKTEKILAFSTSSQMGISFALLGISPIYAALYAFAHSLSKSLLFSRGGKITTYIATASLIGIPPLAGYFAKIEFMKDFMLFSLLILFLTSAYSVKLLKGVSGKMNFSEIPLLIFLFFPLFFIPFGGLLTLLEILAVACIGLLFGNFLRFPKLKDVFTLEGGIAYQIWALAVALIWVNVK